MKVDLRTFAAAASLAVLCACQGSEDQAQERVEDRIEDSTDASGVEANRDPTVLGLTERQLLEADLVSSSGEALGEVKGVRRNASRAVIALAIEIDDSGTRRLVELPVADLSTTPDGEWTDILAAMTLDELASFPDARRE